MNNMDEYLLSKILPESHDDVDAYNLRKNGQGVKRKINEYIDIASKEDSKGIEVYVKAGSKNCLVEIPVILTESGLKDVVLNDFYIGEDADVKIYAGCGIHNNDSKSSEHNGIHAFYLEKNSKVEYVENHFADGEGKGKKNLNPTTKIFMEENSYMLMSTTQISGVDNTIRTTEAELKDKTTLVINEKILTTGHQKAITDFKVNLIGKNSSVHVVSRSVAEDNSYQEFKSDIIGQNECYGHVECDAIIKDNGNVKAIPKINAMNVNASLIHEATIGKIAGSQLNKLMSLGLSAKEAEEVIIKGFLK